MEIYKDLNSSEKNFKAQSLSIYPELLTIYDFSKFNAKKIKLENSYLETDFEKSRYIIKEIFKSIQGEGFFSGKEAVFLRFTGCNLWNGRKKDRNKSICNFCDTNFVGTDGKNGGRYNLEKL